MTGRQSYGSRRPPSTRPPRRSGRRPGRLDREEQQHRVWPRRPLGSGGANRTATGPPRRRASAARRRLTPSASVADPGPRRRRRPAHRSPGWPAPARRPACPPRGEPAVQQAVDDERLQRRPRDVRVESQVAVEHAVRPRQRLGAQARPPAVRAAGRRAPSAARAARGASAPAAPVDARGPDAQPRVLRGHGRVDRRGGEDRVRRSWQRPPRPASARAASSSARA